MNRREIFKKLALAGGLAIAPRVIADLTDGCFSPKTPKQPEGPFYPVDDQLDKDTDLTHLEGSSIKAEGKVVYITGQVIDKNCEPIRGAIVEIWQACVSGRYNHPGDDSGLALDKNFQYWGIARTDDSGKYLFKTILPGSYPAGAGWIRPPHIHYKISALGFFELITQLYFSGNPLNDQDRILMNLPASERVKVVVPLKPSGSGFDPESQTAEFSITLERVT